MSISDDFDQAIKQMRSANQRFLSGDAASFQACWSHADDVTIFGGFGAYEKGWEQVGPRLDRVAASFKGGDDTFEPISMGMSGDLAYLVYLQHGKVQVNGQEEWSDMALRVTEIFRREEQTWKIIHRHADPIKGQDHVHDRAL